MRNVIAKVIASIAAVIRKLENPQVLVDMAAECQRLAAAVAEAVQAGKPHEEVCALLMQLHECCCELCKACCEMCCPPGGGGGEEMAPADLVNYAETEMNAEKLAEVVTGEIGKAAGEHARIAHLRLHRLRKGLSHALAKSVMEAQGSVSVPIHKDPAQIFPWVVKPETGGGLTTAFSYTPAQGPIAKLEAAASSFVPQPSAPKSVVWGYNLAEEIRRKKAERAGR